MNAHTQEEVLIFFIVHKIVCNEWTKIISYKLLILRDINEKLLTVLLFSLAAVQNFV